MEPHGVIIRTSESQRMVQTMNNDSAVTRRDFLKKSAKTGAGLAALGGITFITEPKRVFGAGDRVQVAIIGLNGRGGDHIKELSRLRSEEHTSELQSPCNLVCRLLLEKKKTLVS